MRCGLWVGIVALMTGCNGKKDEAEACTAFTVTVTVTTPENEPMLDANVTAVLEADPTQEITCPGTNGVYTCAIPTADVWKVYSEAVSYEPYGKEVDLSAGDVCEQALAVQMVRESAV